MKRHQGIWLPDHEQHLIEWMNASGELVDGRGSYQIRKLRAALGYVTNWRAAVDVGAHVGFWSMHLIGRFERLHAFEPLAGHRDCWWKNMLPARGAMLYPFALGRRTGGVALTVPLGSSGGTHIDGAGAIEMRTLDSFDLENVDFLKVDVEGYELDVLVGASATLLRCHPCVIVEQKGHTPGGLKHLPAGKSTCPAVDFLIGLGAKLRQEISGDFILNFA